MKAISFNLQTSVHCQFLWLGTLEKVSPEPWWCPVWWWRWHWKSKQVSKTSQGSVTWCDLMAVVSFRVFRWMCTPRAQIFFPSVCVTKRNQCSLECCGEKDSDRKASQPCKPLFLGSTGVYRDAGAGIESTSVRLTLSCWGGQAKSEPQW